jgi:hypothetical protein
MITEYYNESEILREINTASEKAYDMINNGWFHKKLNRMYIKNKKFGHIIQEFTINKQKYSLIVYWTSDMPNYYNTSIETTIERKNGKTRIVFSKKDAPVVIASPHFFKRLKERCEFCTMFSSIFNEGTKYKRNGRDYELVKNFDDLIITRRSKENKRIVYAITALTSDMCSSNKNYQELLSRVDSDIDSNDVYEWQ